MSAAASFAARVPPCPWLPDVRAPLDHTITRRHGAARGADFYQDALAYAQSHWRCGKPAQAILQLNKAWSAADDLPRDVLAAHPPPYRALVWILQQTIAAGDSAFLGNPVRHFQHLATRMTGPRREIRVWRAWTCFHLARLTLPSAGFPPDGAQLAATGLWLPSWQLALNHLHKLGWPGEPAAAIMALADHGD